MRQAIFCEEQKQRFRVLHKVLLEHDTDDNEDVRRLCDEACMLLRKQEDFVREAVAQKGIPREGRDDLVRLILADACLPQNLRIFRGELDADVYLLGCILYHVNEYRYHHGAPDRSFRGLFEGVLQVSNNPPISEELQSLCWRTIHGCLTTDDDGYQFSVLFQSSFCDNLWWALAMTMDIYLRVLFYALASLSICEDFIQLERRYFREAGR